MVHGTYHDGEYASAVYEPRRSASQAMPHQKLTRSTGPHTAPRGPKRRGEGPLPPPEEEVSAAGTAYPHALTCINSPVLRKHLVRTVVLTVVRTVECTMERTVVPTVVPVRGCFHVASISPTDRPELPGPKPRNRATRHRHPSNCTHVFPAGAADRLPQAERERRRGLVEAALTAG